MIKVDENYKSGDIDVQVVEALQTNEPEELYKATSAILKLPDSEKFAVLSFVVAQASKDDAIRLLHELSRSLNLPGRYKTF